ncbi:MAG: squalene/phytoene synthase family protein [Brevirhabdus sp.]
MSLEACATLVARGDPDRFNALRAAPGHMQAVMWPLLALNLEVARAPWVTAEPMIAQMRQQWWRDVLDEIAQDKPPRAHEVAQPLCDVLSGQNEAIAHLDRLIDARRWDLGRDPFPNVQAQVAYLEDTSAGLLLAAARCLGWDSALDEGLRNAGLAFGVAGFWTAVPALVASGRKPVINPSDIAILSADALDRLTRARKALPRHAAPLLRMGWMAEPTLKRAVAEPEKVMQGALAGSEFAKRGRLARKALTGGW